MNMKCSLSRLATLVIFSAFGVFAEEVSPGLITEALFMYDELPGVNKSEYLSPTALKLSPDKQFLYVAENTARRLDIVNVGSNTVVDSILLPNHPTGIDVGEDGMVYVTCFSPSRPMGVVCVIDGAARQIRNIFSAGHSPRAPILNGSELYICNQFENVVSVMDVNSGQITDKIQTVHEPYEAAITSNGAVLLVANYLPHGRSDVDTLMAEVTVINLATKTVYKNIELFNGAQSLNGICIDPNDEFAYISHIRSLHTMTPLNKIDVGWINANTVSMIHLRGDIEFKGSFLLDNTGAGAANPWGIACTEKQMVVSTAGTHEIHVVDIDKLHKAIDNASYQEMDYSLSLSIGFTSRKTVGVKGPRSLLLDGDDVYVAGYFSDEIEKYHLSTSSAVRTAKIDLGGKQEMDIIRSGKFNFSEAKKMCFQGWQSCISCHPDARADGLKWDLENDGQGNFKNDKSLLYSHVTPPSMITGVRDSAETATRKGIELILFWDPGQLEDRAHAIDMYLRSVRAVPSPYLNNGLLSESARRGKIVFDKLDCGSCHTPDNYFTDQTLYQGRKTEDDIGPHDGIWDTPTLHEVWRTAPYSYDGVCATMRCMYEPPISHGVNSAITEQELTDLVEYVNSL